MVLLRIFRTAIVMVILSLTWWVFSPRSAPHRESVHWWVCLALLQCSLSRRVAKRQRTFSRNPPTSGKSVRHNNTVHKEISAMELHDVVPG